MEPKKPGWEGTLLLFFMMYTVLTGISYTLGVTFRTTIPWIAIPVISFAVAFGFRVMRNRRR
jgi:quinol-cytochrome oxidoreductase complex cytochrome b subunit